MEGSVLVVDDEDSIRHFLSLALGQAGYRVEAAASGRECLLQVGRRRPLPQLIILDHQMPGLLGGDVVRILRCNPATSSIPVIMLSGSLGPGECPELERDVQGWLSKPCDLNVILQTVSDVLLTSGEEKPSCLAVQGE